MQHLRLCQALGTGPAHAEQMGCHGQQVLHLGPLQGEGEDNLPGFQHTQAGKAGVESFCL